MNHLMRELCLLVVWFFEDRRVIICMLLHDNPLMVTRSGSQLTMVAHAFNASIQEAEARRGPPWVTHNKYQAIQSKNRDWLSSGYLNISM